ncbi:hypothetical protein C8J57DRAFT_1211780 [Mycena rebaudengoi]|nr:hypothetical protein C8J57DRAFT_1211780 [Mycena rebaudengoi]
MLRLDLSTTRAAGLEVLLGGGVDWTPRGITTKITFRMPGMKSATHYLHRVGAHCDTEATQSLAPQAFIFDTQLDQGIVGPVFSGTCASSASRNGFGAVPRVAVVAKVALYEAEKQILLHEASIYARMAPLQGRGQRADGGGVVPRVFGVFACPWFMVLILQHLGRRVEDMSDLSMRQRSAIYHDLTILHRWGIMHADVRMDNIVVSETGEASLIDFSHARTHWCPGPLFVKS